MILPLYIDPGTGSMIFSLFIGLAAVLTFAVRSAILKITFFLSGGKAGKNIDKKNIPFVIFSDHKRYWNVFHGLCDEFEAHGVDLTYYTASPDDPVLSMPYKHIHAEYLGEKNKPYAKMNMLHADIVVATTPGLGVYQWKRSRYVKWYVHIPHGLRPLYAYRMFGLDHYDAVLVTGSNQTKSGHEIEAFRPSSTRKEYVTVGSPTMDNLLSQIKNAPKRAENSKKVVLVAPSWGKSGILSKYGSEFLSALLKTNYEVIVRPHPQTVTSEQGVLTPLMKEFPKIEWNFDNDNFAVLNSADILISDFSGTMFDFAFGFEKPIIYTDVELDTAPYDMAWHNGEIWEFEVLPKIGTKLETKDFGKIGEIIQASLENENFRKSLEEVRSECWENIGESAKAEFEYLMKKHKEIEEEK